MNLEIGIIMLVVTCIPALLYCTSVQQRKTQAFVMVWAVGFSVLVLWGLVMQEVLK